MVQAALEASYKQTMDQDQSGAQSKQSTAVDTATASEPSESEPVAARQLPPRSDPKIVLNPEVTIENESNPMASENVISLNALTSMIRDRSAPKLFKLLFPDIRWSTVSSSTFYNLDGTRDKKTQSAMPLLQLSLEFDTIYTVHRFPDKPVLVEIIGLKFKFFVGMFIKEDCHKIVHEMFPQSTQNIKALGLCFEHFESNSRGKPSQYIQINKCPGYEVEDGANSLFSTVESLRFQIQHAHWTQVICRSVSFKEPHGTAWSLSVPAFDAFDDSTRMRASEQSYRFPDLERSDDEEIAFIKAPSGNNSQKLFNACPNFELHDDVRVAVPAVKAG